MKTDVVVIGGGASGLIAALNAAEQGASVLLLDKNAKLGRKLRITGKGRCNLTNECEVNEMLRHIPGDGRFLYSALNRFSPSDTMAFFEENGVRLKTERGNRVFPVSDRAGDIAQALVQTGYAVVVGLVFGAIYIRTGDLFSVIFAHAAMDITNRVFGSASVTPNLVIIAFVALLAIEAVYAFVLVSRGKTVSEDVS